MPPRRDQLYFFLGGYDLEMVTIRDLLSAEVPNRVSDKKLGWGAKASAYRAEITDTLARGLTPVLIELENDLAQLGPEGAFCVVDHHGEQADIARPTSLHQVFGLLDLPPERWTRWFGLVAANDRGYIPAMLAIGATQEEIRAVRAADRAAQGISPAEEQAGEQAASQIEVLANGGLTKVCLPHTKTATVTDRLHPGLGGGGYTNLLILSPNEVNFYGAGELIRLLKAEFPGGWYGGALPEYGFWGHGEPVPKVLEFLLTQLDA